MVLTGGSTGHFPKKQLVNGTNWWVAREKLCISGLESFKMRSISKIQTLALAINTQLSDEADT